MRERNFSQLTREEINEYNRRWRNEHRERVREYNKKYLKKRNDRKRNVNISDLEGAVVNGKEVCANTSNG